MLARSQDILKKAQEGGYAVGAFNTSNLEITQAIIQAADELRSPVIVQTTPSAIVYAGLEELYALITAEIHKAKTKVVLHLDHAKSFETVEEAIETGWHSVMIDASNLSFQENVRAAERVVNFAHARGVSVEAELGSLGVGEAGLKIGKSSFTDPDEAQKFVNETKIDSLAVSVGNVHGAPKGEKINIDLIAKIRAKVEVPLVLHGSSGVPISSLKSAVKAGICKVNIDTNIRKTVISSIDKSMKGNPDDYRDVFSDMRHEVKELVKKYIIALGSSAKG